MNYIEVPLPHLGVNDITAKIVEWHINEGDYVNKGEIICTVETTKSIFDIEAHESGNCYFLINHGDEVNIGNIICLITKDKVNKEDLINLYRKQKETVIENRNNEDIKITEKAKLLAKRLNIDISKIEVKSNIINEEAVLAYYENLKSGKVEMNFEDTMDNLFPDNRVERIAIIGAGDGAIQIMDCLNKISNQKAVMLFDDNKSLLGKKVSGVPVIGNVDYDLILNFYNKKEFDKLIISVSTSIAFREREFNNFLKLNIPFTI
jgi:NADH/NAD ratio-sensing transcriptional regulator Rex